jgi:hypothetical protein
VKAGSDRREVETGQALIEYLLVNMRAMSKHRLICSGHEHTTTILCGPHSPLSTSRRVIPPSVSPRHSAFTLGRLAFRHILTVTVYEEAPAVSLL